MTDLEFGPVELVLAAFEGDRPKAGVLDAILDLADAGTVRLLDLVYVTRSAEGEIDWIEIDDAGIEIGELDLAASGIASHEDLQEVELPTAARHLGAAARGRAHVGEAAGLAALRGRRLRRRLRADPCPGRERRGRGSPRGERAHRLNTEGTERCQG